MVTFEKNYSILTNGPVLDLIRNEKKNYWHSIIFGHKATGSKTL